MLERAFLKQFFTWLEEATLTDLRARQEQVQAALEGFREDEARRDARFLLKHLNREILDRHFGSPGERK